VTYAQDAERMSADRDLIYSSKVKGKVGDTVAVYRKGKKYVDQKTGECLGYFAFKAAQAQILEKQKNKTANDIVMQVNNNLESVDQGYYVGVNLWPKVLTMHYLKPKLVQAPIEGVILDVWDPYITLLEKNSALVISLGSRDGLSIGSELEVFRTRDLLDSAKKRKDGKNINKNDDRPEIRVGRVLVYDVSEKLSLAILNEMYDKVVIGDKVRGETWGYRKDPCADKNLDLHPFDDTCEKLNEDKYLIEKPCEEQGLEEEKSVEKICNPPPECECVE